MQDRKEAFLLFISFHQKRQENEAKEKMTSFLKRLAVLFCVSYMLTLKFTYVNAWKKSRSGRQDIFGCYHFISTFTTLELLLTSQEVYIELGTFCFAKYIINNSSRSFFDTYNGCRFGVNIKQKLRFNSKSHFRNFLFLTDIIEMPQKFRLRHNEQRNN
jgi:hypothetical protein